MILGLHQSVLRERLVCWVRPYFEQAAPQQGPCLDPKKGQEGGPFPLFPSRARGAERTEGAERWTARVFWGRGGRELLVTAAAWLLCKINMII